MLVAAVIAGYENELPNEVRTYIWQHCLLVQFIRQHWLLVTNSNWQPWVLVRSSE